MLKGLKRFALLRNDVDDGAGILEALDGLRQLGFLESVTHQDGNVFSIEIFHSRPVPDRIGLSRSGGLQARFKPRPRFGEMEPKPRSKHLSCRYHSSLAYGESYTGCEALGRVLAKETSHAFSRFWHGLPNVT